MESLQIQRFTIDDVKPTKTLQRMNKAKLIKEIEKLEKHALRLDEGLVLLLRNLQSVKKAKAKHDAEANE
jgi:hypothetical protein